MPKYKKCPRCDINYILNDEDYCVICEKELKGINTLQEIDDEDLGEICPRCGNNYLNDGETLCETCALEMEKAKSKIDIDIEPDRWDVEDDLEDDILLDDDVEISLEELQDEETWEDDESEEILDGDDLDEDFDFDFDDEDESLDDEFEDEDDDKE